jgi:hypothetical protein
VALGFVEMTDHGGAGNREFRQPIMAKMGDAKSSTDLRRDIMSDEQWATFPHMRRQLARGGWGSNTT